MTFHLTRHTTTGSSRRKTKFRSAEAAAQSRSNEAEWLALKERWGVEEQDRKRNAAIKAPAMKSYTLSYPPGREPKQHIPSLDTGVAMAARPADKVYTGDKIIGIGTMHKSNAVPVFSDEQAEEIARMRR